MTESTDEDLKELREELGHAGIRGQVTPEDFGLTFRDASTFTDAPVRGRSRWRWVGPGVAAAVAVALSVVVLVAPDDGAGGPLSPQRPQTPEIVTVAQVLNQAAEASGKQPDGSQARYWRVDSVLKVSGRPSERRTVWLGHGRKGLVRDDFGRAPLPPATFGLMRRSLTWDELISLPTNPVRLHAFLLRETRGYADRNYYVAKMATQLLAESPAPPALRRALWQVVARVQGIELRGRVADVLGRTGFRLVLGMAGRSLDLVVDPSNGTLLQSVLKTPSETVRSSRTVYTGQRAVSRLPR